MPFAGGLLQHVQQSRPRPLRRILRMAVVAGYAIGRGESYAIHLPGGAIGVGSEHPRGAVTVVVPQSRRQRRAHPHGLQRKDGRPRLALLRPGPADGLQTRGADALHFEQALGVFLDDPGRRFTEKTHDPSGGRLAHSLDQARGEVALNALESGGRLHVRRLHRKLPPVGGMLSPGAFQAHPFSGVRGGEGTQGRDHFGGRQDHANDGESALLVGEGDRVYGPFDDDWGVHGIHCARYTARSYTPPEP